MADNNNRPKGVEYARNVRKTLEYSAKQIMRSHMPRLTSTINTNSETVKDVFSFIKTNSANIRRSKDTLMGIPEVKSAVDIIRNLKEDAMTGKFYNDERQMDSLNDILGNMGMSIDSAYEETDWNDIAGGDDPDESVGSETNKTLQKMLVASELGRINMTSQMINGIADSQFASAQYMGNIQMTSVNTQLLHMNKMHNESMSMLTNIQNIGMSQLQFNNDVVVESINRANKYYDESINELRQIREYLHESTNIQHNIYSGGYSEGIKSSKVTIDSIIDAEGVVNIKDYMKAIKQNINDIGSFGLGGLGRQGLQMAMSTAAASPWAFLSDMMARGLLPKALKMSMENLDKSVSGLFSGLILKMNSMGKDSNGIKGGLAQIMGKVLGVDMSPGKIDLTYHKRMGITGDVEIRKAKAITEVIPEYLSKLVALQTGKEMKYDYSRGIFIEKTRARKEHDEESRNMGRLEMRETEASMKKNLGRFNFTDPKQSEAMNKDFESFMQFLAKGNFFNPRSMSYEDLQNQGLKLEMGKDSYKLFASAFLEMSKAEQLRANKEQTRAVSTQRRKIREFNQDLQNSGMSALYNEYDIDYDNMPQLKQIRAVADKTSAAQGKPKNIIPVAQNTPTTNLITPYRGSVKVNDVKDITKKPIEIIRQEIRKTKEYREMEEAKVKEDDNQTLFNKFKGSQRVGERFKLVREKVSNMMKSPADFIVGAFDAIDRSIYKIIYGDDGEDPSKQSLVSKIRDKVDEMGEKALGFLDRTVLKPLHDKLFGEDGMLGKITGTEWGKELKGFLPKGVAGALGGMVGSAFLPGGPLLGAFVGAGIAFASHSEKVKEHLFGKLGEDGNRDDSGIIPPEYQATFKKYFPSGLKGAAAGVIGSWFLPGGPILGSLLGATIGVVKESDKFKNWMWGDVDPETNKRQGGVAGQVRDFLNKELFDPFKKYLGKSKDNVKNWFNEAIKGPLEAGKEPIKQAFSIMSDTMKKAWNDAMGGLKDTINGIFERSVGLPLKQFVTEKILDPMKKTLSKFFGFIGKTLGNILSAPVKAITGIAKAIIEQNEKDNKEKSDREKHDDGNAPEVVSKRGVWGRLQDSASNFFADKSERKKAGIDETKQKSFLNNLFTKISIAAGSASMMYNKNKVVANAFGLPVVPEPSQPKQPTVTATTPTGNVVELGTKKYTASFGDVPKATVETPKVKVAPTIATPTPNATITTSTESTDKPKVSEEFKLFKKMQASLNIIAEEVRGQLNGVGYNLEYIKNILVDQYGTPSMMPNMLKRSARGNYKRRGLFGMIFGGLKTLITKPLEFGKNIISGIFDKLNIGKAIGRSITGAVKLAFAPFKLIKPMIETMTAVTKGMMSIVGVVSSGVKALNEFVGGFAKGLATGLGKGVGAVAHGIGKGISGIGSGILAVGNGLKSFSKEILPGVAAAFKAVGSTVWGIVKGAAKVITAPFRMIGSLFDKSKTSLFGKKKMVVEVAGGHLDNIKTVETVKHVTIHVPGPGGPGGGQPGPLRWFADGGVVTKPKIIGVGEAGPEAVIPLHKLPSILGGMMSSSIPGGNSTFWSKIGTKVTRFRDKIIPYSFKSKLLKEFNHNVSENKNIVRLRRLRTNLTEVRSPQDYFARVLDLLYTQIEAILSLRPTVNMKDDSSLLKKILGAISAITPAIAQAIPSFPSIMNPLPMDNGTTKGSGDATGGGGAIDDSNGGGNYDSGSDGKGKGKGIYTPDTIWDRIKKNNYDSGESSGTKTTKKGGKVTDITEIRKGKGGKVISWDDIKKTTTTSVDEVIENIKQKASGSDFEVGSESKIMDKVKEKARKNVIDMPDSTKRILEDVADGKVEVTRNGNVIQFKPKAKPTFFERVKTITGNAMDSVKTKSGSFIDNIKSKVSSVFDKLPENGPLEKLKAQAIDEYLRNKPFDNVVDFTGDMVGNAEPTFMDKVKGKLSTIGDVAKYTGNAAIGGVVKAAQPFTMNNILKAGGITAGEKITGKQAAMFVPKLAASAAKGAGSKLWTTAKDMVKFNVDSVVGTAKTLASKGTWVKAAGLTLGKKATGKEIALAAPKLALSAAKGIASATPVAQWTNIIKGFFAKALAVVGANGAQKAAVGKVTSEIAIKAAGLANPITAPGEIATLIAMAVYDVTSGAIDAPNIFQVSKENTTAGMRVASGLAKGLSGLVFGLIPVGWLAGVLYKAVASKEDEAALSASQGAFDDQYQSYVAGGGTMSKKEWNNQQNKTVFGKVKDGFTSAYNGVKSFVKDPMGSMKKAGDWVGNKMDQSWLGQKVKGGAKSAFNFAKTAITKGTLSKDVRDMVFNSSIAKSAKTGLVKAGNWLDKELHSFIFGQTVQADTADGKKAPTTISGWAKEKAANVSNALDKTTVGKAVKGAAKSALDIGKSVVTKGLLSKDTRKLIGSKVKEGLTATLNFGGSAWENMSNLLGDIRKGITDTLGWFTGKFTASFDWVKENIFTPIKDTLGNVYTWFTGKFYDGFNWVKDNVFTPIKDKLSQTFDWLSGTFMNGFNWVKDNILTPVKDTLGNAWNWLSGTFMDGFNWVKDNIFSPIKDTLSNTFNWFSGEFYGAFNWVKDNIFAPIKDKMGQTFDWLSGSFSNTYNWVKDNIFTPMKDSMGNLKDAFNWTKDNVFNPMKDNIGNVYNAISGSLMNGINQVRDVISPIKDAAGRVYDVLSGTINNTLGGISGAISGVKDTASKISDTIWNVMGPVKERITDLVDKFKDFIDKFKIGWGDRDTSALDNKSKTNTQVIGRAINKKVNVGRGDGEAVNGFAYYNQQDPRWSKQAFGKFAGRTDTVGEGGCGPTVAAMVNSTLTGQQITPDIMSKEALSMGYKLDDNGTLPQFFNATGSKYGVKYTDAMNYKDVANALSNSQPVVLMGQNATNANVPFGSNSSHYVVATGMDGRGNVTILDPQERKNNKKFNINDVLANTTSAMVASQKPVPAGRSFLTDATSMLDSFTSKAGDIASNLLGFNLDDTLSAWIKSLTGSSEDEADTSGLPSATDASPSNGNALAGDMTKSQFIKTIFQGAQDTYRKYRVLPSLTLAQAALESGWGNSGLAKQAYNLFGIKATGSEPYVVMPTTEYDSAGRQYRINAKFRKYNSFAESIEDHGVFLARNSRYRNTLAANNYVDAANAIGASGYATSRTYGKDILNMMTTYGFDKADQGQLPPLAAGAGRGIINKLVNKGAIPGQPTQTGVGRGLLGKLFKGKNNDGGTLDVTQIVSQAQDSIMPQVVDLINQSNGYESDTSQMDPSSMGRAIKNTVAAAKTAIIKRPTEVISKANNAIKQRGIMDDIYTIKSSVTDGRGSGSGSSEMAAVMDGMMSMFSKMVGYLATIADNTTNIANKEPAGNTTIVNGNSQNNQSQGNSLLNGGSGKTKSKYDLINGIITAPEY